MANLVVHFEIHASEPQKLIDFYSSLLGWKFQDYGGGEQPYWVIDTGEGAIGNAAGQPGLGINGGLMPRRSAITESNVPRVAHCALPIDEEPGSRSEPSSLDPRRTPRRPRPPASRGSRSGCLSRPNAD